MIIHMNKNLNEYIDQWFIRYLTENSDTLERKHETKARAMSVMVGSGTLLHIESCSSAETSTDCLLDEIKADLKVRI